MTNLVLKAAVMKNSYWRNGLVPSLIVSGIVLGVDFVSIILDANMNPPRNEFLTDGQVIAIRLVDSGIVWMFSLCVMYVAYKARPCFISLTYRTIQICLLVGMTGALLGTWGVLRLFSHDLLKVLVVTLAAGIGAFLLFAVIEDKRRL